MKKMLTIDMKGSELNPRQFRPVSGPAAYSLNRGKRVEQLTKVTHENRVSFLFSFFLANAAETAEGPFPLQSIWVGEGLQREQIPHSNALEKREEIHRSPIFHASSSFNV